MPLVPLPAPASTSTGVSSCSGTKTLQVYSHHKKSSTTPQDATGPISLAADPQLSTPLVSDIDVLIAF